MHCPYSFNICPLPHRVLLIVPLITSMGIKIHYSAALPTPHQLSTSLVSTLSKLAMISLFSFSVFLLFVCLFAVISFWFGDICLGVFPPEILIFSPEFVFLFLPSTLVPGFHYYSLCTALPTSIIV